jgi:hypothetical protein
MKDDNSDFWTIFNVLGRIIGVGFIVVGLTISIYGATQHDWISAGSCLVVVVLGVLLIKAKPSRPSSGDSNPSDSV